jgi:sulfate adenylyltransferase subunit 1
MVNKNLIRLFTAGNVDDGKSTLIGRLLFDSGAISTDILHGLSELKNSRTLHEKFDLSYLTDGLRAEREQGITIDVAYKYFSTETNKYIISDTPGHLEYTRNMFTGASLCDIAIILIDVNSGITEQTKRHSKIVALLQVSKVIVAVNKMDLIYYNQEVFEKISSDYLSFAQEIGLHEVSLIPLSALNGEQVTFDTGKTSWYQGETLLEHITNFAPPEKVIESSYFRFQLQHILPCKGSNVYFGELTAGSVAVGQKVQVGVAGMSATIDEIISNFNAIDQASAGMPIALKLKEEINVSRGSIFYHKAFPPNFSNKITATLCWMSKNTGLIDQEYFLQLGSLKVIARINKINNNQIGNEIQLNEIVDVEILTKEIIAFDNYLFSKELGSFILIDLSNNATLAAGTIQ